MGHAPLPLFFVVKRKHKLDALLLLHFPFLLRIPFHSSLLRFFFSFFPSFSVYRSTVPRFTFVATACHDCDDAASKTFLLRAFSQQRQYGLYSLSMYVNGDSSFRCWQIGAAEFLSPCSARMPMYARVKREDSRTGLACCASFPLTLCQLAQRMRRISLCLRCLVCVEECSFSSSFCVTVIHVSSFAFNALHAAHTPVLTETKRQIKHGNKIRTGNG